jgi:hypothetical protein
MVRHLAVAVSRDDLLRSEREKPRTDKRIGHDGLGLFDGVTRPIRVVLLHDRIHSSTNSIKIARLGLC